MERVGPNTVEGELARGLWSRAALAVVLAGAAVAGLAWLGAGFDAQPAPPEPPSEGPHDAPAWFAALSVAERPPLPLPQGVSWAEDPGDYRNAKDGTLLRWIPPGAFDMGSEGDAERPLHRVSFAEGFYLAKYETTWAQYLSFCEATGHVEPPRTIDQRDRGGIQFVPPDDHPVINVRWEEARAYCFWARLRLPRESEWEYAARGPQSLPWPWGEEPGPDRLNAADQSMDWRYDEGERRRNGMKPEAWDDGYSYSSPVGSFPRGASPFGCLDMAGNVWEWVQPERTEDAVHGVVDCGGSWGSPADGCRATSRYPLSLTERSTDLGFRPARSP